MPGRDLILSVGFVCLALAACSGGSPNQTTPDGSAIDSALTHDAAVDGPSEGAPGSDAPILDASCDADVADDVNNCGACGHVCPHLPGTVAACHVSACTYACIPSYADCNHDLTSSQSDGCEVDLQTDPDNCGTCGKVCPGASAPHTAPSCSDQGSGPTCGLGCAPGYADCNLDSTDGCEVSLGTDGQHCGECGNACPSQSCASGICAGEAPFCELFSTEVVRAVGAAVAGNGSGFALAWNEFTDGYLHLGQLDANGRPVGTSQKIVQLVSWDRYDLGFDGTSYVLAWGDQTTLTAQRFQPSDLSPVGASVSQAFSDQVSDVVVASGNGEVLIFATIGLFGAGSAAVPWPSGGPLGAPSNLNLDMAAGGVRAAASVSAGFLAAYPVNNPVPMGWQGPQPIGAGVLLVSPSGTAIGPGASLSPNANFDMPLFLEPLGAGALLTVNEGVIAPAGGPSPGAWAMPFDAQGSAGSWTQVTSWSGSAGVGTVGLAAGATQAGAVLQSMSQNGAMLVQPIDASGALVGSSLQIARAPTPAAASAAPSNAGTLYLWTRDRQVGGLQDVLTPIEASFVGSGGVQPPCN